MMNLVVNTVRLKFPEFEKNKGLVKVINSLGVQREGRAIKAECCRVFMEEGNSIHFYLNLSRLVNLGENKEENNEIVGRVIQLFAKVTECLHWVEDGMQPTIYAINLSHNNISGRAFLYLFESRSDVLKQVSYLRLNSTQISMAGLSFIAQKFTQLKKLYIDNCSEELQLDNVNLKPFPELELLSIIGKPRHFKQAVFEAKFPKLIHLEYTPHENDLAPGMPYQPLMARVNKIEGEWKAYLIDHKRNLLVGDRLYMSRCGRTFSENRFPCPECKKEEAELAEIACNISELSVPFNSQN